MKENNRIIDITGMKRNMLTAIRFHHKDKSGEHYWLFKCDCGAETVIRKSNFKGDKVRSCGCLTGRPKINKIEWDNNLIKKLREERKTAKEISETIGVSKHVYNNYISKCNCNGIFL